LRRKTEFESLQPLGDDGLQPCQRRDVLVYARVLQLRSASMTLFDFARVDIAAVRARQQIARFLH
jgi:hypothetical protein